MSRGSRSHRDASPLTERQLNRALLARQHLLARAALPVERVVEQTAGLNAQDPQQAYLSPAGSSSGRSPGWVRFLHVVPDFLAHAPGLRIVGAVVVVGQERRTSAASPLMSRRTTSPSKLRGRPIATWIPPGSSAVGPVVVGDAMASRTAAARARRSAGRPRTHGDAGSTRRRSCAPRSMRGGGRRAGDDACSAASSCVPSPRR